MSFKQLTELHFGVSKLKRRLSLHLSKYHIVGNHMSRLNFKYHLLRTIRVQIFEVLLYLYYNVMEAVAVVYKALYYFASFVFIQESALSVFLSKNGKVKSYVFKCSS